MDWRFFGAGIVCLSVGVIDLGVQLGKHAAASADDENPDAPTIPGFSAAATLKQLQGTWKIDDDNTVTISGATATRIGDPAYSNAKLVVHSPCSYAVDHDNDTFDVPFAMTPTGPRWDDTDGIRIGTTTVICNGVEVTVITNGKCSAWNATYGDKWKRDDDTCALDDNGGGRFTLKRDGEDTELEAHGDILYSEGAGDVTPVRYESVDAMHAEADAALEQRKAAITAASDPGTLVALANAQDDDVANGLGVKITGWVDSVDTDDGVIDLRTLKVSTGRDNIVRCNAEDLGKTKEGQKVTVDGTIESVSATMVLLEPCAVEAPVKKHH